MARQARTTENLKERIADALLELCSEKPFPDISISEITDRADVGRATYYRHFSSKEDVIVFKFKTIFESLPVPDPHKIRPHFDPDFQPPKNRVTISADTVTIPMYSPTKNRPNFIPEYSM